MIGMDEVYHIILSHGDSLAAQHVVLGDAQGDGAVVDDGEAPGTALRLVAGLVVHLGRDGVHPFRQAHAGGVGKASRRVDLRGDHFAVQDEHGAQRLDARAGLRIRQGGGDDRPRGGDDRAVGRDGVADEGRLVVIGVPPGLPQGQAPLWGLQAEEGGPLGLVVDVVGGLGAQDVRHARRHGGRVVGGGGGPGGGAPVDVVARHAAAAIAGPAPGKIRIVTRVLPYAVAGDTAGLTEAGLSDAVASYLKVKRGVPLLRQATILLESVSDSLPLLRLAELLPVVVCHRIQIDHFHLGGRVRAIAYIS
jgi:hypothetical protein